LETILKEHPLYEEIQNEHLPDLLLPYMRAFLENNTFFWELEVSLDSQRTIFYQGLCYWMYKRIVLHPKLMALIIQLSVDDGMGSHFLVELDKRHEQMHEANMHRFNEHNNMIVLPNN